MSRAIFNEPIFVIALVMLVTLVLAGVAAHWVWSSSRLGAELKRRFGSEYDLAVQRYGRFRARRTLTARLERVKKLRLRPLTRAEREEFEAAWRRTEEHFVDAPLAAVGKAQELVREVLEARGYPAENFEQSVANLSVHHGEIVQHYRSTEAIDEAARSGTLEPADSTKAIGHFRTLFAALLAPPSDEEPPRSQSGIRSHDRASTEHHSYTAQSSPYRSSHGR